LKRFANVSEVIGAVTFRRLATLYELQTVYSYRDALDMYEIILTSNYNERVLSEE
jgi:hypothetical protein